jgi:hypothetical protein
MLVGGYFDYRLGKKKEMLPVEDSEGHEKVVEEQKKTSRILSGAVSGEAIVTVIFVLWNAVMFFAP